MTRYSVEETRVGVLEYQIVVVGREYRIDDVQRVRVYRIDDDRSLRADDR
jgi:hypothetical protein